MPHDSADCPREIRCRGRQIRRILFQDGGHRLRRRVALESAPPGQHLVEDRAQRKQICPRIDGLPADLLGRHVAHGSEDGSGVGPHVGLGVGLALVRKIFGQPEIQNLDLPVAEHEDVLRFQISMDDALVVSSREPSRDLRRNLEGLSRRELRAEVFAQRLTVEQFRHRVRRGVGQCKVENREDVRVRQCGDGPCLTLEASSSIRIVRDAVGQYFDGDVALEARITRPIDLPHAAGAEGRDDFVTVRYGTRLPAP